MHNRLDAHAPFEWLFPGLRVNGVSGGFIIVAPSSHILETPINPGRFSGLYVAQVHANY